MQLFAANAQRGGTMAAILLFLAVPIRGGDEADAAVRLGLSTAVVRGFGGETPVEQRAGKLGASILKKIMSV
jgi:hypothetical protein